MRISSNTTGMPAALTIWTDPDGRDHCVVVVKGTFRIDESGEMTPSDHAWPLVLTDEHYGDPETTSVRHECDFAPEKPMGEVLVVGKAVAPYGTSVQQLGVRLEVQGRNKDAVVLGERCWAHAVGSLTMTRPLPFRELPLTFERAFGGQDSSRGPDAVDCEARNPVGVGFHGARRLEAVDGMPLPNIERLGQRVEWHRARVEPIGFNVVGRAWAQRACFAGTYDQRWLDEQCPFLPRDFDLRYFMSAPSDQWCSHFVGGEIIRCFNMSEQPIVQCVLPKVAVPVRFRFADSLVERNAVCDTVILKPHRAEAALLWRTRVPVGKRLTLLKEVLVGHHERAIQDDVIGYERGKPHYRGLDAAIRRSGRGKTGS